MREAERRAWEKHFTGLHREGIFGLSVNSHRMLLLGGSNSMHRCWQLHSELKCLMFSPRKEGELFGKWDDHVRHSRMVSWALHYLPLLKRESSMWRDHVPSPGLSPDNDTRGRMLPSLLWYRYKSLAKSKHHVIQSLISTCFYFALKF